LLLGSQASGIPISIPISIVIVIVIVSVSAVSVPAPSPSVVILWCCLGHGAKNNEKCEEKCHQGRKGRTDARHPSSVKRKKKKKKSMERRGRESGNKGKEEDEKYRGEREVFQTAHFKQHLLLVQARWQGCQI